MLDYSKFDKAACDKITVEIVADSISPSGKRITTFVCEYPRFVHSEIMTHRMLSKSVASSRAIPSAKMIEMVMTNPAMPVFWGKNQPGMQALAKLDYGEQFDAQKTWLKARDNAVASVTKLLEIGLHKQIANRVLETWFYCRAIITGTDFENFFALRAHGDAQPEFQVLAWKMLEAYNASTPKKLQLGDWHIPFGDRIDDTRLFQTCVPRSGEPTEDLITEMKNKIAIARCARVSYYNFEGKDDYNKDIETCNKLFGSSPRHLSPAEHVAQCVKGSERSGNFNGWKQYRKIYADENLTDPRVIKK
jgi:thymidylate synthase ThyX